MPTNQVFNKKNLRVLESIFHKKTLAGVKWRDVEAFFNACDAEIIEGNGSRICVILNGVKAVFHRPHVRKEIDKGALKSVKSFLKEAGIQPEM